MATYFNMYISKKAVLFVSCIIGLSLQSLAPYGGRANKAVTATQPSSETDILAIRKIYQKINSLNLSKQRFTYESSGCADGGVVTYFFNNNKIVKITESGSIGDGSWVNEYYYSLGKIIFCFETIIGGPAIGKATRTETRYYIKNGRVIRVIEGSKIVPADSKSAEAIRTAGNIYKAFTNKDFVSALCNN